MNGDEGETPVCVECGDVYDDFSPDDLCPLCKRRARADLIMDQQKDIDV